MRKVVIALVLVLSLSFGSSAVACGLCGCGDDHGAVFIGGGGFGGGYGYGGGYGGGYGRGYGYGYGGGYFGRPFFGFGGVAFRRGLRLERRSYRAASFGLFGRSARLQARAGAAFGRAGNRFF